MTDNQPSLQQIAAKTIQANLEILRQSEVISAKNSAIYLLRTPIDRNKSQLNGDRGNQRYPSNVLPMSVTDVKVNSTDKEIEVILVAANSELKMHYCAIVILTAISHGLPKYGELVTKISTPVLA